MIETKFTPGPWNTGLINYADVFGKDGECVALVIKRYDEKPQTIANAALISAAPEMYAMLESFEYAASDEDATNFTCPSCDTPKPPDWDMDGVHHEKHKPDCKLMALLAKANSGRQHR